MLLRRRARVVRREQRLRLVIIQQVIGRHAVQFGQFLALERHRAAGFGIAEQRGENRAGQERFVHRHDRPRRSLTRGRLAGARVTSSSTRA